MALCKPRRLGRHKKELKKNLSQEEDMKKKKKEEEEKKKREKQEAEEKARAGKGVPFRV